MSINDEMKKALLADPPASDPPPETPEEPAPTDPASGGDTPPEEPAKEPDPVPYGRFKEKVDEANTLKLRAENAEAESRKLMQDLAEVAKSIGKGEKITTAEKVETKEDIETLVRAGEMTREEADRFIRVLNAAGVQRGSAAETALKKELEDTKATIKTLEKAVYGDKDQVEKTKTLAKFDGIVSSEQLDEKLKEMVKSGDPDRIHMANHSTYEKIIKAEFADEIIKFEVGKALESKKPGAPKIPTGNKGKGDAPKKPATDEVIFKPENPHAFDADLRAAVKRELHKAAE